MAKTYAELWDELRAGAKAELAKVENDLKAIEANIVPVLESEIVTTLSQFKGLAVSLVAKFAGDGFKVVEGDEKLGTVAIAIYYAALSGGKALLMQDAQMLAQWAFQAFATQLVKPAA